MSSPSTPAPVCVFCASSLGNSPVYAEAASSVGRALARARIPLVYGGGSKGLMGLVASSCVEAGGSAFGVIPKAFVSVGERGDAHTEHVPGTEVTVVGGMHERKTLMSQMSTGGFITLPGGFGSFEELLEMATWSQLGIHPTKKPILVLNVKGFYAPLKEQFERAAAEGFIALRNLSFVKFVEGDDNADWGVLAVKALEEWVWDEGAGYHGLDWSSS